MDICEICSIHFEKVFQFKLELKEIRENTRYERYGGYFEMVNVIGRNPRHLQSIRRIVALTYNIQC